ncbi:MAG: hypothetical protein MZV70_23855 [Desulfobacterales bacterium]|nr:hypothetical protein [Desulfobacterales bacterium]
MVDEENLKAGENNYLACISSGRDALGLAFLDLSTGEFQIGEFSSRDALLAAVSGLDFKELLISRTFPDPVLIENAGGANARRLFQCDRRDLL